MKELFLIKKSHHSRGTVLFRWDPTCKYIATVGVNRRVNIFERNGAQLDEFALTGKPTNTPLQIEWDKDGENLAVLCDGHSVIALWNVYEKKSTSFETNLKDPSFMAWSRVGPQLAIGTAKGSLLIYNSVTKKSLVHATKHTKKITCGHWNLDNQLALASLDKTMTINDEKGELLTQPKLKYDPYELQFSAQKVDDVKSAGKENTVSVNMGHQTILMYNIQTTPETDNPIELAFQPKYGEIATYKWFGDGYMMVGFSKGYVIAISTHKKEVGEELQSLKVHEQELVDVVYSQRLQQLATCGEDGVRIVDMHEWKELKNEYKEFNREEGAPERMEWTQDGQILSVSTSGGYVFNFLMSIPVLSAHHATKLVYLSSLRNVSVVDVQQDALPAITLEIAIEPSFIALGPEHVAVGMNNHSWFHTWNIVPKNKDGQPQPQSASAMSSHASLASQPVYEREYLGSVKQIALNETYAAVLLDNGCINLHLIVNDPESERDSKIFPEEKENGGVADGAKVTSLCLTSDFLIYATSRGTLHHFYLKDWAQVVEHRHDVGISAVYANSLGTRCVFIDAASRGWMFSPIEDHKFEILGLPAGNGVEKILFDLQDANTFIVIDTKNTRSVTTFSYSSQTAKGATVTKIPGQTKLPVGFSQIVLFSDGYIHGQRNSGKLASLPLASHDAIQSLAGAGGGSAKAMAQRASRSSDKLRQALHQLLALNRLKQAWDLVLMLKSHDAYVALAKKALEQLDIELAMRVYRELKDTPMVLALQDIQGIEDKDLLSGHILLLQGDYVAAQKYFLSSSAPQQALQMRRDLLHWDLALKLAAQLAPQEMPEICYAYAQTLEVKGDHQQALAMYQRALQDDPTVAAGTGGAPASKLTKEHIKSANGGIARMTMRVGDLQKGRALAQASGDKTLQKECAAILEQMKQYADAADLYVAAEEYEKAASIYVLTMNFAKAGPLMEKITTPKLHLQYAKAKEAHKDYAAAAVAYEKGGDLDSVIRLNLQYLDDPEKAFSIVRETKSAEGATLIAAYCQKHQNFQAAIEFLLLSKRSEEAFRVAKQHRQMDKYCAALGDGGSKEEYLQIAEYYEEDPQARDLTQAGHYYARVGDHARAIKLFLAADPPAFDAAIGVVKQAQGQPGSELLVRQLHDHLIGETDGKVKDLNYIFRLYMAINEWNEASRVAILLANQEQVNGQYSVAHSILFAMHQDLAREKLPIPNELRRNLLLLHSYTLAKKMSVKKEHENAARMLIRVAKNISRFPSHIVPILTSTVIECQRAGLKKDSLEYAKILLRPEHKAKIMPQYLKPIEGFVRRPPSQEELDKEKAEKATPCPFCQFDLPETLLDCPGCKNNLPYCVTTGRHMVLNDWTECPSCKFPTLYSAFVAHLSAPTSDKKCCMCDAVVSVADVIRVKDPKSRLFKEEPTKEVLSSSLVAGGAAAAAAAAASGSNLPPTPKANKFEPSAVDIQPVFK